MWYLTKDEIEFLQEIYSIVSKYAIASGADRSILRSLIKADIPKVTSYNKESLQTILLSVEAYLSDKAKLQLSNLLSKLYSNGSASTLFQNAQFHSAKESLSTWVSLSKEAPFEWQMHALDAWKQNKFRGIVKAVTGTGKTKLGILCMAHLKEINPDLKVTVIVPTIALLKQWKDEIRSNINLKDEQIGLRGGDSKDSFFESRKDIIIYTFSSANKWLKEEHSHTMGQKRLLIVDECHRAGSRVNRRVFESGYDFCLGLSAYPEREQDDFFETIILPKLGQVIFEYGYKQALQDGTITEYQCINYGISLTPKEEDEYQEITVSINEIWGKLTIYFLELSTCDNPPRALNSILAKKGVTLFSYRKLDLETRQRIYQKRKQIRGYEDISKDMQYLISKILQDTAHLYPPGIGLIQTYFLLCIQRMMLVHMAENRLLCVLDILNNLPKEAKIFLFHQYIEELQRINEFIDKEKFNPVFYHTKISKQERESALRQFRHSSSNLLLSCRALDEGIDVPDADVGIIAAASNTKRQIIQRAGRILRKKPLVDVATIYTIYARKTTDEFKLANPLYESAFLTQDLEWPEGEKL